MANLEEAANIATEYLASLENLPNETQFLLTEISHRDRKVQDIQEEIRKESQKYFRHAAKNAGQPLSGKDAAIPDAVTALYAEMDALAVEKIALARRLVTLFERALARLQHDLQKINRLQGDEPGLPATQHFLNTVDNTMHSIQASLRAANVTAADPPAPPAAPAGPPPQKKRRVAQTASAGSIKLPSPVPVSNNSSTTAYAGSGSSSSTHSNAAVGGGSGAAQRAASSLSRQVHPRQSPVRPRRGLASSTGPDDEEPEAEDDVDDGAEDQGDAEDQELYCFCQKLSYGEMIACDYEQCKYQWFHISCVNVKAPLPETWYCDECKAKLGFIETFTPPAPLMPAAGTGGGRKGRKKQ